MSFELERILYDTEDFLLRTIRSGSTREARKRRWQRKIREALRRLKRSGFLLVAILAGLLAYSLLVAPIGFVTWLVAIPTAFLFAFLALFWPSRRAAAPDAPAQALPLDELAARAEDALLERCEDLPGRALPAADAIAGRLRELQPCLARLDPDSVLAGDARRLIGQHLPRLVDSYLDLPPSARAPGAESSRRFIESLNIVAGEMGHLLEMATQDRQLGFDTQHRFIETRYKEDERLKGG